MRRAAAVSKLVLIVAVIAVISGQVFSFSSDVPRANLRWKTKVVTISISDSLTAANSSIKYGSDVSGAISRSLSAWENAADISFQRVNTKSESVSPLGKAGDGVSLVTIAQTPENVLLFGGGTDDVSAKTRVFYDRNGFITEADIVLNPFLQFSTDGTAGTVDLESTLVHEVGHLLGLDHSPVLGAAMYENNRKNGAAALNPHGLSEQDVSAVRALYGAQDDETCCGKVEGTLTILPARPTGGSFVWAESVETGRVIAEAPVTAAGQFSLGGLSEGNYRLYFQSTIPGDKLNSTRSLGKIAVERDDVTTINRRIRLGASGPTPLYIGVNGVISTLAASVEPGRTTQIFIGGKGINQKNITIGSDSPFVSVSSGTISQDYGGGVTVLAVDIHVDDAAPPGEYSLFAESANGARHFLVGSLVIGRR